MWRDNFGQYLQQCSRTHNYSKVWENSIRLDFYKLLPTIKRIFVLIFHFENNIEFAVWPAFPYIKLCSLVWIFSFIYETVIAFNLSYYYYIRKEILMTRCEEKTRLLNVMIAGTFFLYLNNLLNLWEMNRVWSISN